MKAILLITCICALLVPATCLGQPYPSQASGSFIAPKVTPEGVFYPTVRTKLYPHKKEKTPLIEPNFETMFGVRRWLGATTQERELLENTLSESKNWLELYGGYGVLGHGEEVFTQKASIFREQTRVR